MHELTINTGTVTIKKVAQSDSELKKFIYLYNGGDYKANEALYNQIIAKSALEKQKQNK